MLQKEYDEGVRHIIATRHFRYDMFEPPLELVKTQFLKVKREAEKIGIKMYLGCELHATDMSGENRETGNQ